MVDMVGSQPNGRCRYNHETSADQNLTLQVRILPPTQVYAESNTDHYQIAACGGT